MEISSFKDFPDGLYFGMSDDDYHNIPRLSASGIKNLLISTMDFWNWSWMNPHKEQVDSAALIIGRAYHKRILEGQDAFNAAYAPDYQKPEGLEELDTIADMKAVLDKHGIQYKSAWKKEDYVEAVKAQQNDDGKPYVFAGEDRAKYESWHEGKTFLSRKIIEQIHIAAMMIEKHEQLSKTVVGGYPEATILWTCKETGVKMKSRFDYLKVKAITDLKTFTNKMRKRIEKAIYYAMAADKYHIQSALYYEADNYAREFAATGKVHGNVDPEWLKQYAAEKDPSFVFIFQQKGGAPVTRGMIMPKMQVNDLGMVAVREAQTTFAACQERYGSDPWLDIAPIGTFNDSEFPAFISDL